MCTSPITIKNPKFRSLHSTFKKAYDPLFLRVPCGKCQECQNMKQQEWLIRLAKEYEYTKSVGGFACWNMFSYNEWEVPRFHGLMCFNPEHYKDFAKKLRTYLIRHYEKTVAKEEDGKFMFNQPWQIETEWDQIESEDGSSLMWIPRYYANKKVALYPEYHPAGKVKIFWVSEFGGETQRPHHHAVFFVQYKITPWQFMKCIRKAWTHGFTSNRSTDKLIINSMAGIAYITKYLCKDIEFANVLTNQKNSRFTGYLEKQWEKLYGEKFDKENFMKYPCETVKKILKDLGMELAIPYTRSSRYIGLEACKDITENELAHDQMTATIPKKSGQTRKLVNIPMYLRRKLQYDYNKDVKAWELNDTGRIVKSLKEEIKTEKIIQKLEETFIQPLDTTLNHTEIGVTYENGFRHEYPIDKTVTYKIYHDIKRNKNQYALLLNLLQYRDTIVNEEIIEKVMQGYDYKSYIQEMIRNDYEPVRIIKEHKPHQQYIQQYLTGQIGTWKSLIQNVTKDERYLKLLEVYDMIQTNRLEAKERYLLRAHEAWVICKNQPKRFKT